MNADVLLAEVVAKVSHGAEEEGQTLLVARDMCRFFGHLGHPDGIVPLHIRQGARVTIQLVTQHQDQIAHGSNVL
jgi:hypothetical protein